MTDTREGPDPVHPSGVAAEAARLARALIADAPRRVALALLLLLAAGVTEAFGLVMLVPLLQVVGFGGSAGEGSIVADAMARVANALGVEVTLPAVLAVFLVLAAVRTVAAWLRDLILARVHLEFVDRLCERIGAAIAAAGWNALLRHRHSDLLHVLSPDIQRVGQGVRNLLDLVVAAVLAAVQIALAMLIAPLVTAAAIGIGAVLLGAVYPLMRRAHTLGGELTGTNRHLFGSVTDFLAGLKLARSYDAEDAHVRHLTDALAAMRRRRLAFIRTSATALAVVGLGGAAALAGLIWLAVAVAETPPPELVVMTLIFARVVPAAARMQRHAQLVIHTLPAFAHAQEVCRTLQAAAETTAGGDSERPATAAAGEGRGGTVATGDDGDGTTGDDGTAGDGDDGPVDSPPAAGSTTEGGRARMALHRALTVRGVSFAYGADGSRPALAAVDLDLPAGTLTAIAGPSGAGKSTLADILIGVLEPATGRVLVDGVPLTGSNRRRWRRSISYVPQEPYLFHDTIRANLQWARPGAPDAALWHALRLAAAADFVTALPDGLGTIVGDRGARLSGGERQRLSLARALLREPALLMLDEATSHVDPGTERSIVEALMSLRGSATIVAIAHGEALPAAADTIVRLESGRIGAERLSAGIPDRGVR